MLLRRLFQEEKKKKEERRKKKEKKRQAESVISSRCRIWGYLMFYYHDGLTIHVTVRSIQDIKVPTICTTISVSQAQWSLYSPLTDAHLDFFQTIKIYILSSLHQAPIHCQPPYTAFASSTTHQIAQSRQLDIQRHTHTIPNTHPLPSHHKKWPPTPSQRNKRSKCPLSRTSPQAVRPFSSPFFPQKNDIKANKKFSPHQTANSASNPSPPCSPSSPPARASPPSTRASSGQASTTPSG